MAIDSGSGSSLLPCTSSWNSCHLSMDYYNTPVVYEVTPAVLYYGHEASIVVDPKSAHDFPSTSEALKEVRIDKHLIDFENYDTNIGGYSPRRLKGLIGDQQPAADSEISVKYTTGYALEESTQMLHCSYDGSDCYKIRTVPAIHEVTANSGVVAGGQELTVEGWGFNAGTVTATIDGVSCEVISQSDESFTCVTGAGS